jgi:DNA-binding transcriptional ArsR family regulator
VTDTSGLDTRLAKALSHPLRQRLLMAYTGRVLSPSQIAAELGEPLGDVSYHTKQLVAHGCVELVEAVRGRGGVKHYYRATVPYEIGDAEWRTLSPTLRRKLVEPIVGTIVDDVAEGAASGSLNAEDVHVSRTPLALDERGRRELSRLLEKVVGDALRIQRESAERLGGEEAPSSSVLAILHFAHVY